MRLQPADEGVHAVGTTANWNESRYVDFFDSRQRVGGWFRIGNRPNEGYAEMSVCVYLPSGSVAFMFGRPEITGNGLIAGGQEWAIVTPFVETRVRYRGEVLVLRDPWVLVDPKQAFESTDRLPCEVDLTSHACGLASVMGADQSHIDRIFLPGQADVHYQHLVRTVGAVRVGDEHWDVDGRGGKDHSWGPRNWHAKIYLRWLIGAADHDHGFMLVRAVGPTKQTRSGFVWDDGNFRLVDDFEMHNVYEGPPHYQLRRVEVTMWSGEDRWSATGVPVAWLPLRHRQADATGALATLRIVKSPTDWAFDDGRTGVGMCEYHDLLDDGVPVGMHD